MPVPDAYLVHPYAYSDIGADAFYAKCIANGIDLTISKLGLFSFAGPDYNKFYNIFLAPARDSDSPTSS